MYTRLQVVSSRPDRRCLLPIESAAHFRGPPEVAFRMAILAQAAPDGYNSDRGAVQLNFGPRRLPVSRMESAAVGWRDGCGRYPNRKL